MTDPLMEVLEVVKSWATSRGLQVKSHTAVPRVTLGNPGNPLVPIQARVIVLVQSYGEESIRYEMAVLTWSTSAHADRNSLYQITLMA